MKPIIIAETANNHKGDIEIAKKMIKAAKKAGADYIKFQSWQLKNMSDNNLDKKIMANKELSDEDHKILINECKKEDLGFLTTCFDIERIDFLKSLGLNTIKVASTDVGSYSMLKRLRDNFKKIILSTGMSDPNEVKNAIEILKKGGYCVLHCVALYPTPKDKANLGRIDWLKTLTNEVGYSDHTMGVDAAKIAIAKGAKMIEKHFILEMPDYLDDSNPTFRAIKMAATPKELKEICDFAKEYEIMMGDGAPEMQKEELESRKRFVGRFGDNK